MFLFHLKNISLVLFFWLLLAQIGVQAQDQNSVVDQPLQILTYLPLSQPHFAFTQGLDTWKFSIPQPSSSNQPIPPPSLLQDFRSTARTLPGYDSSHLAFFCRLEVRLEKATKIPVRFRIGDVQQVDYLEGKFTGWRYGY